MTKQMTAVLDLLKDDYIHQLAQQCGVFVTIGAPIESPRWIIYNGSHNKNDGGGLVKEIYFSSSQVSHIFFFLPLDKLSLQERSLLMAIPYEDITSYFRAVKYAYLAEHWPTIDIPEEYIKLKDAGPVKVTEVRNEPLPLPEHSDEKSEYDIQAETFLSKANVKLEWAFERFGKYWPDDEQERNIFTWRLLRDGNVVTGQFGSSIVDSCKMSPALYSPFKCEIYWGVKVGEGDGAMYLSHTINTDYPTILKYATTDMKASELINWPVLKKDHAKFMERRSQLAKKYRIKENMPKELANIMEVANSIEHKINRFITEAKTTMVLHAQADKILTPSAYDLLTCLTKSDPGTFEDFCSEFGYDTDSRRAEKVYNAVKKEWDDVNGFFSDAELDELQEIQ